MKFCSLAALASWGLVIPIVASAQIQDASQEPIAAVQPSSALPDAPSSASAAPSRQSEGQILVSAGGDYVLSPGDTIEMRIFREPDLTSQSTIARDGTVQLPLIQEVRLAGLTVREARDQLRRLYNEKYLVEPQVYLTITDYAERHFTILGQVLKPGTYPLKGSETVDLLEAIGMAGGFTPLADHGRILVKRRSSEMLRAGGKRAGVAPTPTRQTTVPWYRRLPIIGWFFPRRDFGKNDGPTPFDTFNLNAKSMADGKQELFMIQPGDVITVKESWY